LDSFAFAKCYINNIIIFSLTKTDDIHHLQEVLGHLKETTFSCILASVSFSKLKWSTWVMIYLGGLRVNKARVETISQ
jgi:hypothetical protein